MVQNVLSSMLADLYGQESALDLADRIERLAGKYPAPPVFPAESVLTEENLLLITYADSLRQSDQPPLQTLARFHDEFCRDLISLVHLLPFFPYSSDDGFSVIDYRQVNPSLGDWSDVRQLAQRVGLCFDLVINHASAHSEAFQRFLAGDPAYQGFFLTADPHADTSTVLRPRTSPLLTPFDSPSGTKHVWTTFSADQVDWNFQNPEVLLEFLDILFFYVSQGACIIRLDAIAYLWKQLGTSCAHLPQTHLVVRILRLVLDTFFPHVLVLTETNVPHPQNVSYFGDGSNEAHLVYNFPLPPLLLYALTASDASYLTQYARQMRPPSQNTAFLNFTASHDGIGVRPAAGRLTPDEFQTLVDLAARHGGHVSSKADQTGRPIPYELNINYFDAINDPNVSADPDIEIRRFLCSQSVALVLAGVPVIYIHSLLGSRNWTDGPGQTGQPRSINREKLDYRALSDELNDPRSLRGRLFPRYAHMIRTRRRVKAFHPNAPQTILDLSNACFAVLRHSLDHEQTILALHNVTGDDLLLEIPLAAIHGKRGGEFVDLLSQHAFRCNEDGALRVRLAPWDFAWLERTEE